MFKHSSPSVAGRDEQVFRSGSGRRVFPFRPRGPTNATTVRVQRGVPGDGLGVFRSPPNKTWRSRGVFLWDLDFAPGPGRSQTWSSWWTSDSRGNHYGGDVGSDGEHLLDTSAFRTRICPRPCPSAPEHPPRVQSVLVTLKSRGLCVPSCDRFSLVVGARGVPGTL